MDDEDFPYKPPGRVNNVIYALIVIAVAAFAAAVAWQGWPL